MSAARPEEDRAVIPFELNPYAATEAVLDQSPEPQQLELASRLSRLAAAVVPAILLSLVPMGGLLDTTMIFRNNRRCLHDDLAGTMVVKA
ncbi:hypothetical protein [Chitiniphilus eburneus]|uniref:RDD family protein n=1 Tax=Chitiniphilus eburneus TaxID=2571148 RepID=A0A4V5MS73_9NEIS|nr:hypothetical protein [Chitiniphilus eburneus]TJZ79098.1 hypothetical protein FAZ21_02085 [Chitiniphilus eburneus]